MTASAEFKGLRYLRPRGSELPATAGTFCENGGSGQSLPTGPGGSGRCLQSLGQPVQQARPGSRGGVAQGLSNPVVCHEEQIRRLISLRSYLPSTVNRKSKELIWSAILFPALQLPADLLDPATVQTQIRVAKARGGA